MLATSLGNFTAYSTNNKKEFHEMYNLLKLQADKITRRRMNGFRMNVRSEQQEPEIIW